MALFELVLKSIYAGQQCVNRWNYIGTGTPAAVSMSFALTSAAGFIGSGTPVVFPDNTLFKKIRDITADQVEFNEVIVNNVYDLTDFYTTAFPDNTFGIAASPAEPSFIAAGLRTNLVRRDIARGTKRFVGVPSNMTGGINTFNPAYVVLIQALGTKMAENLTYDDEGNTITYAPCVVSKLKYTTPSGKSAYKYYPTLSEQMNHVAQGIAWEAYDTPRSQVSRQIGKGG